MKNGNSKNNDDLITINPKPSKGISIGKIEIPLTPENLKAINITKAIRLNYELGNKHIDEKTIAEMSDAQFDTWIDSLKLQKQALNN
jgi:urease accessory protein UreE